MQLSGSCVAVLSKRSTLKRAVKTMYASGLLPQEQGAPDKKASKVVVLSPGVDSEDDDAWITTTTAYQELQNGWVCRCGWMNRPLVLLSDFF